MQVVITILLCFILALGLFIAYAGLGSRHQSHNAYDVDALYRDRLHSWWNYPFRHYFHNDNSHMYHHNNHHMPHGTGSGHTQTQIVVTAPPAHVPPPPPTTPHVSTPPTSGDLALPQVGSGSHREGAIDMSAIFGKYMPVPSASTPALAPASSTQKGSTLQSNAQRARQGSRINTNARAPALVAPVSAPANESFTDSASLGIVEMNVEGFTPQSYASNCGTYNCAEQ